MTTLPPKTGLAAALQSLAPRAPTPTLPVSAVASIVALRDYQTEFVDRVRAEFRRYLAVLLVAATGAGKTVVFSYIAKSAAAKGSRVLILAHRDQLIKQASRKLNDNGVSHGIIMAGFTPMPLRQVQVASVQTLVRRIEGMVKAGVRFDMVVIDEAHLSAAASYVTILSTLYAVNPKMRVLGVTGSPIRLDGKGLGRGFGGTFDTIVQGISIKQLIAQGYLVKPRVYASKEIVDLSSVRMKGQDYDSEALAEVMDKPAITGNAIAEWRKICPGVPTVAWCANVKHAKHVAEEFNANGIPAMCLSGEDDGAERDRALAALSVGTIKVITFAQLLVEGVDCPAIGAVVILRPTMSLSSFLQTIGRALRPIYADRMPLDTTAQRFAAIDAGPKGRFAFVLDHAGLALKHGLPDADREWSLEGVVKKKGKKREDDDGPKVLQCPSCWFIHDPEPQCPACGHLYDVRERKLNEKDGELAELTEDALDVLRRNQKREVAQARTLDDLKKIAAARGYKESWATHVFEARQRKTR